MSNQILADVTRAQTWKMQSTFWTISLNYRLFTFLLLFQRHFWYFCLQFMCRVSSFNKPQKPIQHQNWRNMIVQFVDYKAVTQTHCHLNKYAYDNSVAVMRTDAQRIEEKRWDGVRDGEMEKECESHTTERCGQ